MKLRLKISSARALFEKIPSGIVALFSVSVVVMNLTAGKSISLPFPWLALDCGFLFSWVIFLCFDVVNRICGAKASNLLTVFGILINLFICGMFALTSVVPGVWSVGASSQIDTMFLGNWYILMGSTVAFFVSGLINNSANALLYRFCKKKDGFGTFAFVSYLSSVLGQFCDNLIFALIVSRHLFGWSPTQCLTCATVAGLAEVLFEIIFSPLGYWITKKHKS